jgi:hypothetical protein
MVPAACRSVILCLVTTTAMLWHSRRVIAAPCGRAPKCLYFHFGTFQRFPSLASPRGGVERIECKGGCLPSKCLHLLSGLVSIDFFLARSVSFVILNLIPNCSLLFLDEAIHHLLLLPRSCFVLTRTSLLMLMLLGFFWCWSSLTLRNISDCSIST